MLDLKEALQNIATKWNYKLEEISPGQFRMDVGIKDANGAWRFQFVYLWIIKGRFHGKDTIYMNSRCGEFTSSVNLYNLIKEAGYLSYSSVTITNDTKADGRPCETVVLHASPALDFTTEDLLSEIIYEIAFNADFIEQRFFGGDNN
jgi:hypothetical protein